MKGYVSVVLHAHLPYVRHVESDRVMEERWLFEAITETYIPLLQVFSGLERDGADFHVAMTLTPTLLAMLEDSLLQQRYLKHIGQLVELAERELIRTANTPDFHTIALHYHEQFQSVRDFFVDCKGDLISHFRALQDLGHLEVITCSATHAFLPYIRTREAIRAQIQTAVTDYQRHFGRRPRGIWLPECGYTPGVDEILDECGLSYFFVGSDAFSQTLPCAIRGSLAPVLTECGVAAFPRDDSSSKQVWSSVEGYPGDYDYREYYRDIGYDLDEGEVRQFLHPSGIRHDTGIKYYRITGKDEPKQPYTPSRAREKAAQHAGHFLASRIAQVEAAAAQLDCPPIVVAPYDAELLGHWWYEGPQWLDFFFRKLHFDQDVIESITPSAYLDRCTSLQICDLGMSSWGAGGFGEVWLNGTNDWVYPALHACETHMTALAGAFSDPTALEEQALNQAARELMLAQSSDFAFIMDHQTVTEYAVKRTKVHINRFMTLYNALQTGTIDAKQLDDLTIIDPLFPLIDYRHYRTNAEAAMTVHHASVHRPTVLMLAWEFPPVTVGGLSRHVYDLSRYLTRVGWDVHVLTVRSGDSLHDETVEGVQVHRVDVLSPDGGQFKHWAFQFNLAMLKRSTALFKDVEVDVVHAHDWMVCYAAKTLKDEYNLPLVATIHATEYGRNRGIHSPLQHYVNHLEWELTYEAAKVVLCSTYMKDEVERIFALPTDKLCVIANGVDPSKLQPAKVSPHSRSEVPDRPVVLYIGRLVREKGVQVLVEAAPEILSSCHAARFVILGAGPYQQELKDFVAQCGVSDHFEFRGFVSDEERNQLLQEASAAVFPSLYEPFGIVALEAMAAGAPVVVADVGGLADVVMHGENGRKAYVGDAHSLAVQVCAAILQPQESARMAEVAKSQLDRYDWLSIAKETVHVYEDALRACGVMSR